MKSRMLFGALLAIGLAAAAPMALADDPVKDILDREVPALTDGTHMSSEAVQRAILDACARRQFQGTVNQPGSIVARWTHGSHWFEISISYTDSAYSIRYKDSGRMDYDATRHRIDDAYNDSVAGLVEHIDAHLDDTLDRIKKSMRAGKRVARINPRTAV